MATNNEYVEVKVKIERLGKLLIENSEKAAQACIAKSEVPDLDELLIILEGILDISK